MARYRTKDETDLIWNDTRRRLVRELDTQITSWRERTLNVLLTHAWEEHSKALSNGEVLEVQPEYNSWVAQALSKSVNVGVERVGALESEAAGS